MSSKMSVDDYCIYGESKGCIFLVAHMLAYSMDWPPQISYHGKDYKFNSNEFMEDWMVGYYSGHARYVEIDNPYPIAK